MRTAQCTLEINLAKIRANYCIISEICKNSEVAAVVKANCYGLGADFIAPALQKENCQIFFVATIDEGISLRKILGKKANILVFNGVFNDDVEEFGHNNLIPILNCLWQVEIWRNFATRKKEILPCAIHIDTGMNRFGMREFEIQLLIDQPSLLEGLDIYYIISHLAMSEAADIPYNMEQLIKFKNYLNFFPKIKASLSNSAGVFLGKEYHFDLIRPGGSLYGLNPLGNRFDNLMHNPVRLTAPIIQLHKVPSGSYIGYNMTYKTTRDSMIATLPLGYADGYSRALSNCGQVFIDSQPAPVVGVVSMDLITIDVTDLSPDKIFLGQEVEIIGNNCTPDKIANIIDTIGYEIITMQGNRHKKIYKNDF
jgi:alanine racemase